MTNQTAGLICAHHHLYSTLARGMPATAKTPSNFLEILQQVWWRLDAALDNEMIYWSAMLGACEALMNGTTCIIDHHESPNCIEGSLSTIARACSEVGVRVNACYGVTDRWDNDGNLHSKVSPISKMTQAAQRGLAECDRYLSEGGRGMVGAHAAFTCSDETLNAASELAAKHKTGVHIHVAEGQDDAHAGARLENLSQDNWLLIHAIHLDRKLDGRIVHNPRSNMNNSVGYARPSTLSNNVLLGTDGIGADMFEEARLAYVRLREFDVTETPDTVWSWIENSYALFPEAKGDTVTFNYDHVDSSWHVAFTPGLTVTDVEIGGEKVLTTGLPTRVDINEVRAKAAEQAVRLHERLAS
jgi:cytosine/adenosine deaminase-related metal-dependent hydrolase